MDTIGHRGMVEEDYDIKAIGIRFDENGLPIFLKGMRAGLSRVGKNAVGDFQTVNVRLIFRKAGEGALGGFAKDAENTDEQE